MRHLITYLFQAYVFYYQCVFLYLKLWYVTLFQLTESLLRVIFTVKSSDT
jgi:hypothetical protein